MFEEKSRFNAEESSKAENLEFTKVKAIQDLFASGKADALAVQSAINAFPEGILIGDLWGYITHLNDAIVKMMGASDSREFIGKHILFFLPKETRGQETADALSQIMTNQSRRGTYHIKSKTGQEIQLDVSINLLFDEQGEKIGFFDIVKVVTPQ